MQQIWKDSLLVQGVVYTAQSIFGASTEAINKHSIPIWQWTKANELR